MERLTHPLEPVFDAQSRILILGTFPSPKSRRFGFYYSHPQNRFWPVMEAVYKENIPTTIQDRKAFILRHHLALWDVLHSCRIQGADDQSIQSPVPNDLSIILNHSCIQRVLTTGQKASALYRKYCQPQIKIEAISLPSTSSANCRYYTLEKLIEIYREHLLDL